MYGTYISMVCLFLGSAYVNQSSYFARSWVICVSTYAWVRMSLGVFMFIGLFQLRVYQYITIFIWKRRAVGKRLWIPIGYVYSISVIYAIASVALPQNHGFDYDSKEDACITQNAIYIFGLVLLGIQLVVTLMLTVKARKINACFNEFREIVAIIVLTCIAGVISACTRWLPSGPNKLFESRLVNTLAIFFATEVNFFIILGPPIYHSIFNKEEHLRYFMRRMKMTNLVRQYEMA
ncbi:hypothetical protein GQ54DRAFT_252414, partial [Martensiomyces pterosporus]